MRTCITLVCFAVMLLLSRSSFAGQERSFGVIDRLKGEDPSCDLVNRAYERTANASNYVIYVNELRGDGKIIPDFEDWLTPTNEILYYSVPNKGSINKRPMRLTVLQDAPLLRNCRFVAKVSTIAYGRAQRYAADWQRGTWKSRIDIWIATDTNRFLQASRDFSGLPSPFPFSKTLEIYRYPGQHGRDPKTQSAVIPF